MVKIPQIDNCIDQLKLFFVFPINLFLNCFSHHKLAQENDKKSDKIHYFSKSNPAWFTLFMPRRVRDDTSTEAIDVFV